MSVMRDVPCDQCGAPLRRYPSQIDRHNFCDRACLGRWRSAQVGSKAAHWKGGEKVERGRVYWHLPWHPQADKKGYVERARIVAEIALRSALLPREVVHHKDEDQGNDHPDNLEVLPSQSEHARLHGLKRTAEQMAAMREKRGRKTA